MEFLFLFLSFSLFLDLHHDVPLSLLLFLLTIASCTLIWHGGRRRERDLFATVSWTKAGEGIREILEWRVLVTFCHRLFVDKSLWRRGYAFLTTSMSIRRTTPARRSASRALKQVL